MTKIDTAKLDEIEFLSTGLLVFVRVGVKWRTFYGITKQDVKSQILKWLGEKPNPDTFWDITISELLGDEYKDNKTVKGIEMVHIIDNT